MISRVPYPHRILPLLVRFFFFCPGCFVAAKLGEEESPTGFGDGINPSLTHLGEMKVENQQMGEATPKF